MSDALSIYTDGSCKFNPGPGGWAWVRMDAERELEHDCGSEAQTTNNRMELVALIKALERFAGAPGRLLLVTDSTYVQQGLQRWLTGWKQKRWRTSGGQPVKNQDLWRRLDELYDAGCMRIAWVKGHADDPGNARADYYAQLQAKLRQSAA